MERELRDMVANGVYEAGFENLRRHLRAQGDSRVRASSSAPATGSRMMPSRLVRVSRYGGPEVLEAGRADVPPPGPGEVRIQQRAAGVNFIDIYLRRGWMPGLLPLPGVLGMEAAGVVVDVGPGVNGFDAGDRVAYMSPHPGAYCSVRNVPVAHVVRLPPSVDEETAAAVLLKGVTADYLVRDLGRVGPGTRVLVHAAAGGVGLLVGAWARRMGATVLGTVSSDAKARVAREHGCQHVIVTRDYRFADDVRRHCGGADLIIDGLGDAARQENLATLASCGHWISLGQASGPLQAIDPQDLAHKSATFSRPVVFDYVARPGQLAERAQRVWDALEQHVLRAPPIERFTLDAAARAHERLESRASTGALVLIP
jgi:NADPH:quinone reductase-like Zn-dependent oxidoreductase